MQPMQPMRAKAPTKALDQFPYLASPKIDGIRAVVRGGIVLSKTLKPIPNIWIQMMFRHLEGADGELTVGVPFAQSAADNVFARTRGYVMTQRPQDKVDIQFHIFDRWDKPLLSAMQRVRNLPIIIGDTDSCYLVQHEFIKDQEDADRYELQCLKQGYEGIMLRGLDSRYKYGLSTQREGSLIKIKRFLDAEAQIIGFEEQRGNTNEAQIDALGHTKRSSAKGGKIPKGTLGAFIVRDLLTQVVFSVGNGVGLTDALRKEFWDQRHELIGRYITYQYQAIGSDTAPRLPQFIAFRDAIDIADLEGG